MLSDGRFEPPRKPYLKLHGDIASRTLVFLTGEEIQSPPYDASMLKLLESIVRNSRSCLRGLRRERSRARAHHCRGCEEYDKPDLLVQPESTGTGIAAVPVARQTRATRAREVRRDDDGGSPPGTGAAIAAGNPAKLPPLSFEWRLDYCNREYLQTYGQRDGTSLVGAFARRPKAEDQVRSFLLSNRALTVISGPSGFGKTTLGIRLHSVWNDHRSSRILLIRTRALPSSGDVEQHVVEQLGGLGSRAPFSLFRFERWLAENQLRLILYVDGINEFDPELTRCVQLFRSILRFCYFLPEADSAIRVITTIRQETWNVMLSHLDLAQLQKTLWTDTAADQGIGTISCGEFTDDELRDAVTRLHERGYANIETDRLPAPVINQLHDPYLFGMIAEASHQGMPAVPGAGVYQRAFEAKLRRRASLIDTATLKDVLASLALGSLSGQQDKFREIDIEPAAMRGEIVRLMKDLHVFVEAGDGYLQFDHDRTLEFFLALGLGSGQGPSLETVEDLLRFLKAFRTQAKPVAAARLYFQLRPREKFGIIERILRMLDDERAAQYGMSDRELLFGFGREVLLEMTEQGEPIARQYLMDVSKAAATSEVGPHLLRAVVQLGAGLPVEESMQVLTNISHAVSSPAAIEANIYATDKLVTLYLEAGCPDILLSRDQPYAAFFGDTRCPTWQRLGRLLGFAAHLGPDNTHPDEYSSTLHVLNNSLDLLLREQPWIDDEAAAITRHFKEYCDQLLFNATPEAIDQFFESGDRGGLIDIAEKLGAGRVLSALDFEFLRPYTQTLQTEVHYHLCHLFLAISSFNNCDATLDLVETRLASMSNASPPIEIDFLHAALVYLHVLHNVPYDAGRFADFEGRILQGWPDVLLFRPGLSRGERRGFQDLFDRVFEDGFGVIYPYGVLRPSERRRASTYKDYLREMRAERASQLPLYTKYLEGFLASGRIEEALQVLQALAGVIVLWPMEGLLTLRGVIGYPDPRIRRAVVRVLAEAFNRHPAETLSVPQFQRRRRKRRRFDRDQNSAGRANWSAPNQRRRMGAHRPFPVLAPGARKAVVDCALEILRAESLDDAVTRVLQRLGLLARR